MRHVLIAAAALFGTSLSAHAQCTATASAVLRNGSGANPAVLNNQSPPVLGGVWHIDIDCTGHDPALSLLVVRGSGLAGQSTPFGELLIDPASPLFLRSFMPHNGRDAHWFLDVPNDPSLCGLTAVTQGLCLGAPAPQLTNAYDLTIGD